MKWDEVRQMYPHQWVVIEALSASSKESIRYIEEMALVNNFPTSTQAWKEYKKLHLSDRSRELYIFHTNHQSLQVTEERFIGVREKLQ